MASSQDGNSNCVEDITTNKTPSPEKDESPGYKSNKINCETAVNISTNSRKFSFVSSLLYISLTI